MDESAGIALAAALLFRPSRENQNLCHLLLACDFYVFSALNTASQRDSSGYYFDVYRGFTHNIMVRLSTTLARMLYRTVWLKQAL